MRHNLITHTSRLDTFSKVRERVQVREAARGAAPMQIGEAKGTGELVQAEKEKDDAKKLAEKNTDKQCCDCWKKGHVKSGCRNRLCDMKFVNRKQTTAIADDEITCVVIEGIPNMASSCHDCVFAMTEKPSLGNNAIRWKRLVVHSIISFPQEPVSALQ